MYRLALSLIIASVTVAPAALAQSDSALAQRVRRLEALLALVQAQLAEQATATVTPRGRHAVDLSGTVLLNGFFNNGTVDNADVPMIAAPPDPSSTFPASGLGGSARQTRLSLGVFAPGVLGGTVTGEVDVDFFGGQLPSAGGRSFPLVRLRRARADLAWRHATLMIGQDAPLIAEHNPSSLATIGVPGFTAAGNLWMWIPQARLAVMTTSAFRLGLEGAVLAPRDGGAAGAFATQPDRAERARRPFLEGRLFTQWGDGPDASEVSVGGHYGWIATAADTLLTTSALAASVRVRLARFLEIRGEVFSGQALGTLGGGGIGQSLGVGDTPVHTSGGWAQLNLLLASTWEFGGGFGIDDPANADLDPATARLRNLSYEGHLHWRPHPLVFGIEFRRLETTYGPGVGTLAVNHINVATGFVF